MIKILVVEDEQRVAELLKRGLEESGYQVELAYDGAWGVAPVPCRRVSDGHFRCNLAEDEWFRTL